MRNGYHGPSNQARGLYQGSCAHDDAVYDLNDRMVILKDNQIQVYEPRGNPSSKAFQGNKALNDGSKDLSLA